MPKIKLKLKGRPGWHIECSAMSSKYLGETFDIHGGGIDLVFPHHQNEIAQSEGASGKKFVKYWVHNEWLLVDGQKMSKSLGNFYTLRDVLAKGHHPLAARYFFLSTHYRQQFNFTFQGIEAARNALQRIWDFVKKLDEVKGKEDSKKASKLVEKSKKSFEKALDDDLDIAKALAVIFELIRQGNILMPKMSEANAKQIKEVMIDFDKILGFIFPKEEKLPDEIAKLIEEREKARAIKNWSRSDEIRDELKKKGIIIEDTPQGVRWKKA